MALASGCQRGIVWRMYSIASLATDIREILEKFRGGAEEEPFFELLEMPGDLLSPLTAAFRTEQDPALGAFLVKIAGERREPKAIYLPTEALNQTDEEIWQAALDGLVTFASREALAVLIEARTRELTDEATTKRFQSFVTAESMLARALSIRKNPPDRRSVRCA